MWADLQSRNWRRLVDVARTCQPMSARGADFRDVSRGEAARRDRAYAATALLDRASSAISASLDTRTALMLEPMKPGQFQAASASASPASTSATTSASLGRKSLVRFRLEIRNGGQHASLRRGEDRGPLARRIGAGAGGLGGLGAGLRGRGWPRGLSGRSGAALGWPIAKLAGMSMASSNAGRTRPRS